MIQTSKKSPTGHKLNKRSTSINPAGSSKPLGNGTSFAGSEVGNRMVIVGKGANVGIGVGMSVGRIIPGSSVGKIGVSSGGGYGSENACSVAVGSTWA